ncbi:hypothetical protein PVAP13_9NG374814 [Panicum virgatum]|nr:hypothetical protein PVAP13_9NG374814 [Panicum virgatum]
MIPHGWLGAGLRVVSLSSSTSSWHDGGSGAWFQFLPLSMDFPNARDDENDSVTDAYPQPTSCRRLAGARQCVVKSQTCPPPRLQHERSVQSTSVEISGAGRLLANFQALR